MRFSVVISPTASQDLKDTHAWYASADRDVADRWYNGILAAISSLANNPRRCGLAREDIHVSDEIRELLYGSGRRLTHRAVFRIDDDAKVVDVIAVRHFAQNDIDPEELP